MNWLSSIGIALLTAPVGALCAGVVATFCVSWYRVPQREGAAGFFVIFVALFGLILGFGLGLLGARLVAGGIAGAHPSFWKGLGVACGGTISLGLVAAALARLAADVAPRIDGQRLAIEFELLAPEGVTTIAPDDQTDPHVEIINFRRRSQPNGRIHICDARVVNGRWHVNATAPLDTRVKRKFVRIYFNESIDPIFPLPVPSRPRRDDCNWSNWIDATWPAGTIQPPPTQRWMMRFRVQVVPLPSPPVSAQELEARQRAAEEAEFRALDPADPLSGWLEYTRYGTPEDRLREAVAAIVARPNFIPELQAAMTADDPQLASDALRLVEHLPTLPRGVVEGAEAAGRQIVEHLRLFSVTTPDQDPHYAVAAAISVRFSAWIEAARRVQAEGHDDLAPVLAEILALARERPDSHVLRTDVVRVASYHLHQWAGVAPLPGDPTPR